MVYSFQNVSCSFAGPGGILNLGQGGAVAEEGISIEPVEDKNVMAIGADGQGQHSLVASDAVKLTIRLLKTSPQNQLLMAMYNLQAATGNSALWGINVCTVIDSGRNDYIVIRGIAFKTRPVINYAKEGGINEWTFDGIAANYVLGAGQ